MFKWCISCSSHSKGFEICWVTSDRRDHIDFAVRFLGCRQVRHIVSVCVPSTVLEWEDLPSPQIPSQPTLTQVSSLSTAQRALFCWSDVSLMLFTFFNALLTTDWHAYPFLYSTATRDIEIGVDDDGFIFLSFEAPETQGQLQFDWKKNYKQAIDAGRAHLETKENKCVINCRSLKKCL